VIIVGIDPGKTTGFAIWDSAHMRFTMVSGLLIHQAFREISELQRAFNNEVPVLFEDARQRTWFGSRDANVEKYGAGVREGAGAAKRDAAIWEDFLEDTGVPYLARKPSAGSTKLKQAEFQRYTKWEHKTNAHGRDAGMLVFGMHLRDVQGVRRLWEQRRANQTAATQARR
jgi:hypothetical protein